MRLLEMRVVPLAAMLLLPACDSGSSPVAPDGTIFTISAHPAKIEPEGTSMIRVEARHETGAPVRTGTEIRFETSMGTIDPLAKTDGDGIALATLRAGASTGTATVTATSGAESFKPGKEIRTTVTIERPDNLLAAFATEPADPRESLTIKFKDDSSGDPTAWEWDFGDGATSREQNPLHVFKSAADYRVTLRVTRGAQGDVTSSFLRIGAEAMFTAAVANLEVTFTDESVGNPTAWRWTFGDGGTSSLQSPVHTYGAPGEYRVRLAIDTGDAGSDRTSRVVRVEAAAVTPPEAGFTFDDNGLAVIFTDESDNEPTSWDWDFGDGSASGKQNPVHTYAVAGTYLVTLTVRNAAGSDTISRFVKVS